jgi:hypothetical protein
MNKFVLLFLLFASSVFTATKQEYGFQIYEAFRIQSEGFSTSAMYLFEKGIQSAIESKESQKNIKVLKDYFAWYRTYGYYLGIIKKDPNIIGQYLGNGNYSNYFAKSFNSLPYKYEYGKNPETDAQIREFILGVGEVVSGMFCCWLLPSPPAKRVGAGLVVDGLNRVWDSGNFLLKQKDIAVIEFEKIRKAATEESS